MRQIGQVLPKGTKVFIEGVGERVVEDTGNAIVDKSIDVYVEDVNLAKGTWQTQGRCLYF